MEALRLILIVPLLLSIGAICTSNLDDKIVFALIAVWAAIMDFLYI